MIYCCLGQSGWEATAAIRKREGLGGGIALCTAGILIVGLPAAAATPRDAARCRDCGMNEIMSGCSVGDLFVGQYIRNSLRLRVPSDSESNQSVCGKAWQIDTDKPGKGSTAETEIGFATACEIPRVLILSPDVGRRKVLVALLRSCVAASVSASVLRGNRPFAAQHASDIASAKDLLEGRQLDVIFVDAELACGEWFPASTAPGPGAGQLSRGEIKGPMVVIMSPIATPGLDLANSGTISTAAKQNFSYPDDCMDHPYSVVHRPVSRDVVRGILAAWVTATTSGSYQEALALDSAQPVLPAQPLLSSPAPVSKTPLTGIFSASILVVEGVHCKNIFNFFSGYIGVGIVLDHWI